MKGQGLCLRPCVYKGPRKYYSSFLRFLCLGVRLLSIYSHTLHTLHTHSHTHSLTHTHIFSHTLQHPVHAVLGRKYFNLRSTTKILSWRVFLSRNGHCFLNKRNCSWKKGVVQKNDGSTKWIV